MKTHIEIPCHWNKAILDEIIAQNKEDSSNNIFISELYGVLPKGILGHGRSQSTLSKISPDEAIEFRKYVKQKGIKFNYLLNSPQFIEKGTKLEEVIEYIDWVGNELKPDAVIITSYELMQIIRNKFKDLPIHISTIARISKEKDIEKYLDINPERIIVQHDVNRNFEDLKEIIKRGQKLEINIELMLTESCLRRCSYMQDHYNLVGIGKDDKLFHFKCNKEKVLFPREILKSNFIRPEDISFYEGMGVNNFKITGRSKKAEWLPLVTKAYLERDFKGNIIRLLGIDPNINAEKWIYINNKALNGFLENFPRTGNVDYENKYCDYWAIKLYQQGNLYILGFEYKIDDEKLICKKGLSKLNKIYG